MCKIMSSAKYLQCYLQTCFFPTRILKTTPVSECLQRPCQNACMGCPLAPTPAWVVVTVIGGATTIAPVVMASISLGLKVSIEGAHAILTGKMLHIRIVRGTKEYRYGSCRALIDWYEYL